MSVQLPYIESLTENILFLFRLMLVTKSENIMHALLTEWHKGFAA